ncbi:uncharacterized protein LOC143363346 [Halictus rubicundus]|uniref:uncharacterized protein LOC143363346 n=1 Tax=Halictus rubicundus TaxID=77578 RepID=UPI0040368529
MIQNYQPLEYLNVYYAVSEKGENAIILSSDILVEALSKSTELYVDGTFAVLPKKPHIVQLYTVHIRYMDNGIATLLILCEKRTATLYTAIWEKIINIIPNLPNTIKFIMSDYETAAVKTLSKLFPSADMHGCWFHYCQAVLRKWRKLGLNSAPHTVVHMAMSLPLIPAIKFEQGLSIIQKEADIASSKFPGILLFMTYMRHTWLNIASQVSVHNCPVRTNNIAESFHNIACQKLGKQNINIWAFLEKVKDLLIDQELDLSRLQNGIASRRRRTNANINHRKEITSAQEEYNAGRLSLEEFLNMFTHNEKTFQINKVITLANEDSNDEIEDINYFDISYGPVEKAERVHKKDRRTLPNTVLTSSGSLKTKDTKVTENYLNEPQQCILHSSIVNIQSAQNLHDKFDSNHIDDDDIYEILEDRFWYDKTENQVSNDNNNRKEDIREHKEGYCIICFVKKATQVCVPCGHLACCMICIMRLECNRCPTCNDNFNTHVTLRLP